MEVHPFHFPFFPSLNVGVCLNQSKCVVTNIPASNVLFIACVVETVSHLTHIFEINIFSCDSPEVVKADIEELE